MIQGVNIIVGKISVANKHQWNWGVCECLPQQEFYGAKCPKKILGSKEHLYWLKTDLNVAEIITVQDYKHKQN